MQIDFNIMKEFCKMLELMDKSKTIKHFMWFLASGALFVAVLWRFPEIAEFILTLTKN